MTISPESRLYDNGHVTWHSSDEDSGPDVGMTIGLGDGRMLWVGAISRARYAETEGVSHLGDDFGWWIILYDQQGSTVVGKCRDAESAHTMIEWLEAALSRREQEGKKGE